MSDSMQRDSDFFEDKTRIFIPSKEAGKAEEAQETAVDVPETPEVRGQADVPVYCIYCGKENRPGAKFCNGCGSELFVLSQDSGISEATPVQVEALPEEPLQEEPLVAKEAEFEELVQEMPAEEVAQDKWFAPEETIQEEVTPTEEHTPEDPAEEEPASEENNLPYDLYYRVRSASGDWGEWVKNGEPASTKGAADPITEICMELREK